MTEDNMVKWHHRLDAHEFEQALGVVDGLGSLACCSPWGCKELDMIERLNSTELNQSIINFLKDGSPASVKSKGWLRLGNVFIEIS